MKPNILFLVVDSLRSDRCYETQTKSIIPTINSLIKKGAYFSQAVSSVAATSPSIGSIFTGLIPFKIGMGGEGYEKLNPDVPTYVDHLKNNGYTTYATTSEVNSFLGLTDDFDLKIDQNLHNNYFSLFDGLGSKISKKLESSLKEPWFFYIHINDLHQPILVPEKFKDKKFGITNYEKMLSAIDFWIGKFLKQISLEKTLVVLTADHGDYVRALKIGDEVLNLESDSVERLLWKLGNKIPSKLYGPKKKLASLLQRVRKEKREQKIKKLKLSRYEQRILTTSRMNLGSQLFDDVLRVPIIITGYNVKSRIISQQVRTIDIFPTITELIGLPKIEYLTDGQSLVPLIDGKLLEEKLAYIESIPHLEHKQTKRIGIRNSEFKYIRDKNNKSKNVELYNLKKDPHEELNIAQENPYIISKMEEKLQTILNSNTIGKETSMTDLERKKIEDELRKLGYI